MKVEKTNPSNRASLVQKDVNQSSKHSDVYGSDGPIIEQWTKLNDWLIDWMSTGSAGNWILGAGSNRPLWSRRHSMSQIKQNGKYWETAAPSYLTYSGSTFPCLFHVTDVKVRSWHQNNKRKCSIHQNDAKQIGRSREKWLQLEIAAFLAYFSDLVTCIG